MQTYHHSPPRMGAKIAASLVLTAIAAFTLTFWANVAAAQVPRAWLNEFPLNGFEKSSVDFSEILSGGPPRDGIPSIDNPMFDTIESQRTVLDPKEPVISLRINGEAKAYPLRILTWHEIANDTIGGEPVAVTYCPLCNSALVFDRKVAGQITTLGVSGKLRNSDMIMYDRLTETWWQQFTGEGIVGPQTGQRLTIVPSRLESFERFAQRYPDGKVLVPNNASVRPYGANPYQGYDNPSGRPFLFNGPLPTDIPAMTRVVRVGDTAWTLPLLQEKGEIVAGDLVLTWTPGQTSALDTRSIAEGREVGNVVVQKQTSAGLIDEAYEVTFAFVFRAFQPEGTLVKS